MKKIYKPAQSLILVLLAASFIFPREAFAYIEAGSGSYLAQVLIGIVLGGLFAFKNFWVKIRTMIFSRKSEVKKTKGHGGNN